MYLRNLSAVFGKARLAMAIGGIALGAALALPGAQTRAQAPASATGHSEAIELYRGLCVTCHGAKLEGGEGPSLSDAEWLHGGSRAEIIQSMAKGFPQKGMPAIEGIYSAEQIASLADYILSQQIGWRSLRYEVRELTATDAEQVDFAAISTQAPTHQGEVSNLLVDFAAAELSDFVITYAGDLYVPAGEDALLHLNAPRRLAAQVLIDGVQPEGKPDGRGWAFPLKPGKHEVSISLATAGMNDNMRGKDWPLFITSNTGEVRLAALSRQAKTELENQMVAVSAAEKVRVFRRRVADLPSRSIAVGHPGQLNYAFNTDRCAIVGAWRGEFLNIGPNVIGRGQLGSEPLGSWLFRDPVQISFGPGDASCEFVGLSQPEPGAAPIFIFKLDGVEHRLTSQLASGGVELALSKIAGGAAPIAVSLPELDASVTGEVAIVQQEADAIRFVIR